MIMVDRDEILQLLTAGAAAGLLALVLVLRLNPEVPQRIGVVLRASGVWAAWGGLVAMLSGALVLGLFRLLGGRRRRLWMLPWLAMAVYLAGAVLSRVNVDINEAFLTGSGHRVLEQDAAVWLGVVVLVAMADWLGARHRARWRVPMVVGLILVVPVLRLFSGTLAPSELLPVTRGQLGQPQRGLVVVGVEGLDLNLLLASATSGRYPALDRFIRRGSWGPLHPYRPFLKKSLWTSVAVGAYPRAHGVKSRHAWDFPGILPEPLRLLPTTGLGGAWLIPRILARKVPPPPSALPPLWQRLEGGGLPVQVVGWPGIWAPGARTGSSPRPVRTWASIEINLRHSLDLALARFPKAGEALRNAIVADAQKVAAVQVPDRPGQSILWIELESLAVARRYLEPLEVSDTDERAVQGLILELLDEELSWLVDERQGSLLVLISPYGMAEPNPTERILRTLGGGRRWRASARSCPDGLVALMGPGVVAGRRMKGAQLVDVAPTICYLLGLPVPQYMEGRVLLEAIDPEYLNANSLQVVD